jgi:serine/threonine-protein kinase
VPDHDPKLLATLGEGVRVANRYVIRRVLGKGGMGHVFEVENDAIGRRFALKVLSLSFAGDEAIKRFRREAKALGRVGSARVAQVIDFDVDPALGPFLVMELLDGETLQKRLQRSGRLTVDEAVQLAVELCEALAEVHAAGIVHRDLKPSNIGLTKTGPVAVKLLDFGLAASVDDAFTERLTQSQQFLGTLPYMAPEQFHGQPPTQALDLYALGVVVYEMLAGRTPFVASNPAQYVAQHLASPVPRIESVVAGARVPAWLESIVMKLLAKEPGARFATAAAVASALRQRDAVALESTLAAAAGAIAPAASTARPAARRRVWPWAALAAAVAVGAIGVGAALMASRARHAAPVAATAPTTIDAPKAEAAKAEAAKGEAAKAEAAKAEAARAEAAKVEAASVEAAKAGAAKGEAAKAGAAKAEAAKADAAKQLAVTASTPTAKPKHGHRPAAKKPAKKSWNGEILDE